MINFLKKKLVENDGLYSLQINDPQTKRVANFYKTDPFPNYKEDENKQSIIEKGNKNFLTNKVKQHIGNNKSVLEVGCGTGQTSIYFAVGTNNEIVALDPTIESLMLAKNFSKTHEISNIKFINADIFDDVLSESYFDFIWCNGVLHHTKNPYKAFEIVVQSLKNNGYILIGLYNKIGRFRTLLRKYISKILGKKFLELFDPSLKNLKVGENEKKAWINDQYFHPIESLHTLDEVLNWFKKNNIDYVSSIPSCDFDYQQNNLKIFEKKPKGDIYSRLFNQFLMIFNKLGSDGGLFVVIGKKNESN